MLCYVSLPPEFARENRNEELEIQLEWDICIGKMAYIIAAPGEVGHYKQPTPNKLYK